MTAKSADQVRGFEYDWLASDVDGHVALFSTAGGGYAPSEFLRDTAEHDAAIESILALNPSTTSLFAPDLPTGLKNIWREVAERGLFAFDADGGPYRLVAAPASPIRGADLPARACAVVNRLALLHLSFTRLSLGSEARLRGTE